MRILSVGGEGPAVVGRKGSRAARRADGVAVEIRVDRQRVVAVAAAVGVAGGGGAIPAGPAPPNWPHPSGSPDWLRSRTTTPRNCRVLPVQLVFKIELKKNF
jgi:hypothetical protein